MNLRQIVSSQTLSTGGAAYSACKAGVHGFVRDVAIELAEYNITVNAVAPGAILWPEGDVDEIAQQRLISRTPLKRAGNPTDIAETVLFLVRDAAFLTGQVVNVDGGRSIVP